MIETKPHNAFWRSLHTQGHDSALLSPALGWNLTGMASFWHRSGPVAVNYTVEVDEAFVTRRGSVRGFVGRRRFYHSIERKPDGWKLDGKPQGLTGLADLDLGFTPATNVLQLQRLQLEVGERAEFSVAWFDIGKQALVELPQVYERIDTDRYAYQSPTTGYADELMIDPVTGFVRDYPSLWSMEAVDELPGELLDEGDLEDALSIFSTSSAA
ncbi:putative glycolipid-binding domain-containing protein [Mesorhizobium sp. VNQ89]|uniref:putative glycolipid-binding domain-containing protein n=1 Tax=Mesorhizobium quangtriensis TaxID=3157709 RepID=UPI0032B87A3E